MSAKPKSGAATTSSPAAVTKKETIAIFVLIIIDIIALIILSVRVSFEYPNVECFNTCNGQAA